MVPTLEAAPPPSRGRGAGRARRVTRTLAAFGGAAILVGLTVAVGKDALVSAAQRLGPTGLGVLIALQLACFASDAGALGLCLPPGATARLARWMRACVVANGVNAVTPLGQLGEVFKARLLMRDLAPAASTRAVLLHNHMMFAANAAAVATGLMAGRLFLPLAAPARAGLVTVTVVFAGLALFTTLALLGSLGPRVLEAARRRASRLPRFLRRPLEKLDVDGGLELSGGRRALGRLLGGLGLALLKRALLVLEAMVILRSLGVGDRAALALVTQATAQLVAWTTSFVPSQLGTAEGGTALLFQTLGRPLELALAFELVRRGRRLLVAAVGLVLV